jgi:deoxycytidine triphosphate deaminase
VTIRKIGCAGKGRPSAGASIACILRPGRFLRRKDPQTDLGEASLFLVAQDIRRRIKEGSLVIEPFDESQLGGFAIDLRVGQQFRGLPLDDSATPEQAFRRANFSEIDFGERFAVEPGGTVLGVSFEYVHFPEDLAGFLFPKSSVERTGLAVSAGTIDPGFHGKIAVTIRNVTHWHRLPVRRSRWSSCCSGASHTGENPRRCHALIQEKYG